MEKMVESFIAGNARLAEIMENGKLDVREEKPSGRMLDIVVDTRPQLLAYGEELVSVPAGTRVIQFIKERGGELPVGQVSLWLNAIARTEKPEDKTEFGTLYYTEFGDDFQAYIRLKIATEEKAFFRFIPPEYRYDRGVTVEEDGTVVLCSDLLSAMRTGSYSWCGTEWKWDRDARPVAFTESKSGMFIWFYDHISKNWNGWNCGTHYHGTPVFCRVAGDPDKPDFVSDEPKDSAEFYTDPVFQGISLEKFLGFISSVFWTEGEVKTPQEFAASMAGRPYDSWQGCASFYAVPTPQNVWGWAYETISGRQLIWLPGDMVFSRGMRESQNFRGTVEEALGATMELAEPEWLDAALTLALAVCRPCVSEYGEEPSEAPNERFFADINRKPLEVYEEAVKPPISPVRSYDFCAAVVEDQRATREECIYNALQKLRAAS